MNVTCPGCGFRCYNPDYVAGTFGICEICNWEDDPSQSADPFFEGGANQENLYSHQRIVVSLLKAAQLEYATSLAGLSRDTDWYSLTIQDSLFQKIHRTKEDERKFTNYWLKEKK